MLQEYILKTVYNNESKCLAKCYVRQYSEHSTHAHLNLTMLSKWHEKQTNKTLHNDPAKKADRCSRFSPGAPLAQTSNHSYFTDRKVEVPRNNSAVKQQC